MTTPFLLLFNCGDYNYVRLSVQMGIMQGSDEGLFLPFDVITRVELLIIIDKVLTAGPSSLVENFQIDH